MDSTFVLLMALIVLVLLIVLVGAVLVLAAALRDRGREDQAMLTAFAVDAAEERRFLYHLAFADDVTDVARLEHASALADLADGLGGPSRPAYSVERDPHTGEEQTPIGMTG